MYKLPSANNTKRPLFLGVDESELHYARAALLTAIVSEPSINILFKLMIKDGASACLTLMCGSISHIMLQDENSGATPAAPWGCYTTENTILAQTKMD